MTINIKKLSDLAIIPTRGSDHAAGYDLYSTEEGELKPGERALLKTDISVEIPQGYYGRIAPRSGLAFKNGIDVLAGVIDSDYQGNVGVILYNTNVRHSFTAKMKEDGTGLTAIDENTFFLKKGDRIAQLIIEKCHDVEFNEVSGFESSGRGENGFGSTDKNK